MPLLCLIVLSGCSFGSKQPAPPVLELDGRECEVTFCNNTYTAEITLCNDNKTVIKFTSPENIANTQYTLTNSGLEIELGSLAFSSESAHLPENSLPVVIDCLLDDILSENSLIYCGSTTDTKSGSQLALYNAAAENFDYTVKTDFESGMTKEIISEEKRLSIIFF